MGEQNGGFSSHINNVCPESWIDGKVFYLAGDGMNGIARRFFVGCFILRIQIPRGVINKINLRSWILSRYKAGLYETL